MEKFLEHLPDIISAAAQDPFSMIAFFVTVVSVIAYFFFKKEKVTIKISIFIVLCLGLGHFSNSLLKIHKSLNQRNSIVNEQSTPKESDNEGSLNTDGKEDIITKSEEVKNTNATETMLNKKIGLYYSYGNKKTKNIARQLSKRLKDKSIDVSYYSIGNALNRPDIPTQTHVFGIDKNVDPNDFIKSFKEIFQYTASMSGTNGHVNNAPIIDNGTWHVTLDKDIYIILGD